MIQDMNGSKDAVTDGNDESNRLVIQVGVMALEQYSIRAATHPVSLPVFGKIFFTS